MEHLFHERSIVGLTEAIGWNQGQQAVPRTGSPCPSPRASQPSSQQIIYPIPSQPNTSTTRVFFDPLHQEIILFFGDYPTQVFLSSKFHNSWLRYPLAIQIPAATKQKLVDSTQCDPSLQPLETSPLPFHIQSASISPYRNYLAIILNNNTEGQIYNLKTGQLVEKCKCIDEVQMMSAIWVNTAAVPTSRKDPLSFLSSNNALHPTPNRTNQPHNQQQNLLTGSSLLFQNPLKSPFSPLEFNTSHEQIKTVDFNELIYDTFGSDSSAQMQQSKLRHFSQYILPIINYNKQLDQRLNQDSSDGKKYDVFTYDHLSPLPQQIGIYDHLPDNLTTRQKLQWLSSSSNTLENTDLHNLNNLPGSGINSLDYEEEDEDGDDIDADIMTHRRSTTSHYRPNRGSSSSIYANEGIGQHQTTTLASRAGLPSLSDLQRLRQPPQSTSIVSQLDDFTLPSTVLPHSPTTSSFIASSQSTIDQSLTSSTASTSSNFSSQSSQQTQVVPLQPIITEFLMFVTNVGIEVQMVGPNHLQRLQTLEFFVSDFWYEPAGNTILCSTPSKILHLFHICYNPFPKPVTIPVRLITHLNEDNTSEQQNLTAPQQSPIEFLRLLKFEIKDQTIPDQNQQNQPKNIGNSFSSKIPENQSNTSSRHSSSPGYGENQQHFEQNTLTLEDFEEDDISLSPTQWLLQQHRDQDVSNIVMQSPLSLFSAQNKLQNQNCDKLDLFNKIENKIDNKSENELFKKMIPPTYCQQQHTTVPSQSSPLAFNMGYSTIQGHINPHGNSHLAHDNEKSQNTASIEQNNVKGPKNSEKAYRLSLLTLYNHIYIALHDESSGNLFLLTVGPTGVLVQTHSFNTGCTGRCIISVKHDLISVVQTNINLMSLQQFIELNNKKTGKSDENNPNTKNKDIAVVATKLCLIDILLVDAASMTHQWILLDQYIHKSNTSVEKGANHIQHAKNFKLIDYSTHDQHIRLTAQSHLNYQPQTVFAHSPSYSQTEDDTITTTYIFYPPCFLLKMTNNPLIQTNITGKLFVITPNYYNMLRYSSYTQYPMLVNLMVHRKLVICKYLHLLLLKSMMTVEAFQKQSLLYSYLIEDDEQMEQKNELIQKNIVFSDCTDNFLDQSNHTIKLHPLKHSPIHNTDLLCIEDIVRETIDLTYQPRESTNESHMKSPQNKSYMKSPQNKNKNDEKDAHLPPHLRSISPSLENGLFDCNTMCYCCYIHKYKDKYLSNPPKINNTPPDSLNNDVNSSKSHGNQQVMNIGSTDNLVQVQQQERDTLNNFSWLISRTFISTIRNSQVPLESVTFLGDFSFINPYQFPFNTSDYHMSEHSIEKHETLHRTNSDDVIQELTSTTPVLQRQLSPTTQLHLSSQSLRETTTPTTSSTPSLKMPQPPRPQNPFDSQLYSNYYPNRALPLSLLPLQTPLFQLITTDSHNLLTQNDFLHYIYLPMYYHFMTCPHMNLCGTCYAKNAGTLDNFETIANNNQEKHILCLECIVKQQIRSIHIQNLINVLFEYLRSLHRYQSYIQPQISILLILLLLKTQQFNVLHQILTYGIIVDDNSSDIVTKLLIYFIQLYKHFTALESIQYKRPNNELIHNIYQGSKDINTINIGNNNNVSQDCGDNENVFTKPQLSDVYSSILDEYYAQQYLIQQQYQPGSRKLSQNSSTTDKPYLPSQFPELQQLLFLLHYNKYLNINTMFNIMNLQGIIYELNFIINPKPQFPYIYLIYQQYIECYKLRYFPSLQANGIYRTGVYIPQQTTLAGTSIITLNKNRTIYNNYTLFDHNSTVKSNYSQNAPKVCEKQRKEEKKLWYNILILPHEFYDLSVIITRLHELLSYQQQYPSINNTMVGVLAQQSSPVPTPTTPLMAQHHQQQLATMFTTPSQSLAAVQLPSFPTSATVKPNIQTPSVILSPNHQFLTSSSSGTNLIHPQSAQPSPNTQTATNNVLIIQQPQYPTMSTFLFPFSHDLWLTQYAIQTKLITLLKNSTSGTAPKHFLNANILNQTMSITKEMYLSLLFQRKYYYTNYAFYCVNVNVGEMLYYINNNYKNNFDNIILMKNSQIIKQFHAKHSLPLFVAILDNSLLTTAQFKTFSSSILTTATATNAIYQNQPFIPTPAKFFSKLEDGSLKAIETCSKQYQNEFSKHLQQQFFLNPSSSQTSQDMIAMTSYHKYNPLLQHIFDIFYRRNLGLQILQQLTQNYQTHHALRLISNKNRLLQTSIKYDMYNSALLLGNDVGVCSTQRYIQRGQQFLAQQQQ